MKISNSLKMRMAIGLGLAFCLIFLPAPDASADVQSAAPAATSTTTTNSKDVSRCRTSQSVQQCPSEDGTENLDDNHPSGLLPAIVFSILIVCGVFFIIWRYLRDRHRKTPGYKRLLTAREEITVRSFARSMKKRSELVAILLDEGYKSPDLRDKSPDLRDRNVSPKKPEPDQQETKSDEKYDGKYDGIYEGYYPDDDEP